MKAKLTKVMAMASLAAFLTVGIGANVAQAKDFRFTIGDSPRMKKMLMALQIAVIIRGLKKARKNKNIKNTNYLSAKNTIKTKQQNEAIIACALNLLMTKPLS